MPLSKFPRFSLLMKQIRAEEENENKLEAIRKSNQLKKFKLRYRDEYDKPKKYKFVFAFKN